MERGETPDKKVIQLQCVLREVLESMERNDLAIKEVQGKLSRLEKQSLEVGKSMMSTSSVSSAETIRACSRSLQSYDEQEERQRSFLVGYLTQKRIDRLRREKGHASSRSHLSSSRTCNGMGSFEYEHVDTGLSSCSSPQGPALSVGASIHNLSAFNSSIPSPVAEPAVLAEPPYDGSVVESRTGQAQMMHYPEDVASHVFRDENTINPCSVSSILSDSAGIRLATPDFLERVEAYRRIPVDMIQVDADIGFVDDLHLANAESDHHLQKNERAGDFHVSRDQHDEHEHLCPHDGQKNQEYTPSFSSPRLFWAVQDVESFQTNKRRQHRGRREKIFEGASTCKGIDRSMNSCQSRRQNAREEIFVGIGIENQNTKSINSKVGDSVQKTGPLHASKRTVIQVPQLQESDDDIDQYEDQYDVNGGDDHGQEDVIRSRVGQKLGVLGCTESELTGRWKPIRNQGERSTRSESHEHSTGGAFVLGRARVEIDWSEVIFKHKPAAAEDVSYLNSSAGHISNAQEDARTSARSSKEDSQERKETACSCPVTFNRTSNTTKGEKGVNLGRHHGQLIDWTGFIFQGTSAPSEIDFFSNPVPVLQKCAPGDGDVGKEIIDAAAELPPAGWEHESASNYFLGALEQKEEDLASNHRQENTENSDDDFDNLFEYLIQPISSSMGFSRYLGKLDFDDGTKTDDESACDGGAGDSHGTCHAQVGGGDEGSKLHAEQESEEGEVQAQVIPLGVPLECSNAPLLLSPILPTKTNPSSPYPSILESVFGTTEAFNSLSFDHT
jgi:hypothetical protein